MLRFDSGLLNNSICGFRMRVCVMVMCCCCFLDNLLGRWDLKFLRLIRFNFLSVCVCVLVLLNLEKVRLYIIFFRMFICGKRV